MDKNRRAKSDFWDEKILRWEKSRYSSLAGANPFAWTVRRRMALASRLLVEELSDSRAILDLGCGSGILARAILNDPARRYTGVDFSAVAVAAARARYEGRSDRIRFDAADALSPRPERADLAVFLGLLDWLSDEEAETLFERRREPRLLFSFTETGGAFSNHYAVYRRCVDRTQRARGYREADILGMLDRGGYRAASLRRERRLGPSCLVVAERRSA